MNLGAFKGIYRDPRLPVKGAMGGLGFRGLGFRALGVLGLGV